jgi:hypothetical protein
LFWVLAVIHMKGVIESKHVWEEKRAETDWTIFGFMSKRKGDARGLNSFFTSIPHHTRL